MNLWVVTRHDEARQARELIGRTHYVEGRVRGMLLVAAFASPHDQDFVREYVARKKDIDLNGLEATPESWMWLRPAGGIIAAATMSTLYHGFPRGREQLCEQVNAERLIAELHRREERFRFDPSGEPPRREFLRKLGLAWASRFAVEAPYQTVGVGKVLAETAAKVAGERYLPPAKHLEVLRRAELAREALATLGYSRQQVVENPTENVVLRWFRKRGDFLTRAGYGLLRSDPVAPVWRVDPGTGFAGPPGGKAQAFLLYYHKQLK
ncbi:MAG: hypothetical protein OXU20_20500 [Myxococcales bacterium]|nr:hypothetical protein [Myxococcales bacterium]